MSFSLAGVGLTYVKSVTALDDIRLVADQGEQIALVGPSGAGKTTLLGVIGPALRPASGQVEVLGVAQVLVPCDRDLHQLHCRVGGSVAAGVVDTTRLPFTVRFQPPHMVAL